MVDVIFAKKFEKQFKKLPQSVKNKFLKVLKIFQEDIFSPQLKTHKLHGKYKNEFAFSISYEYRVIFVFIDDQKVKFLKIGTHEIYK